jgi:hypothetical protein
MPVWFIVALIVVALFCAFRFWRAWQHRGTGRSGETIHVGEAYRGHGSWTN